MARHRQAIVRPSPGHPRMPRNGRRAIRGSTVGPEQRKRNRCIGFLKDCSGFRSRTHNLLEANIDEGQKTVSILVCSKRRRGQIRLICILCVHFTKENSLHSATLGHTSNSEQYLARYLPPSVLVFFLFLFFFSFFPCFFPASLPPPPPRPAVPVAWASVS